LNCSLCGVKIILSHLKGLTWIHIVRDYDIKERFWTCEC